MYRIDKHVTCQSKLAGYVLFVSAYVCIRGELFRIKEPLMYTTLTVEQLFSM